MTMNTDHILKLAEIIREVDGGNRLGAAALAEAILSHPGSRWSPVAEPEGLTDEEILNLSQEHQVSYTMCDGGVIYPLQAGADMKDDVLFFARALIAADRARWGRPAVKPEPNGKA